MPFTNINYPSATVGAPSQCSQYVSNHDTYGDGYYAHPTPQRASNSAPQPGGNSFAQGQGVQVQAPGSAMIINTVVLQDATAYDQVVWVQIGGRAQPIPNNSSFIW